MDIEKKDRRAGFTLVEVLTVVALASIIMSIALPSIDVDRFRMNAEIRSLTMFLNTAQRVAILKQHDVVIAFDGSGNRLRMHYDEDNDGGVDEGEETRWLLLSEEVVMDLGGADALPAGSDAISFKETQEEMPSVTFRRNGSASEAGVVYLTSLRATRVTNYKHHSRAVEVERATAQVTCWSYGSETWEIEC